MILKWFHLPLLLLVSLLFLHFTNIIIICYHLLYRVFAIIYLKQTMLMGYTVLTSAILQIIIIIIIIKEAEKKLKYKSLCIEIQRMWNLKCTIVPVIIGATGIVTRSLKKNLETIPGKHSIDSLQKTAILGTSHIIRKVLQCEA